MATVSKRPKLDTKNPNKELADMLLELGEFEKNFNKQVFKYNAYRRAAQSVMEHSDKIRSTEEARKLKHVGKRIAERIEEYLKKGKIDKLEKARTNEDAKFIKELTRVSGIGPSHAHQLVKEGIKSIEDLKKNQDKLNHHQKIGLKHFEDFEKRIPRDEVIKIHNFIKKEIDKIDKNYLATFCGSFRRGAETSGDIDILLTHPNYVSSTHAQENKEIRSKKELIIETEKSAQHLLEKVVNKLVKLNFITDTIALGESKFMGVCQLSNEYLFRRIDIRLIPFDQYWCGVFYFTGSNMFNRNIRKLAHEKGYILNEYSLRKLSPSGNPGKALSVKSEEDIFKYLDIDFIKPEDRTDTALS